MILTLTSPDRSQVTMEAQSYHDVHRLLDVNYKQTKLKSAGHVEFFKSEGQGGAIIRQKHYADERLDHQAYRYVGVLSGIEYGAIDLPEYEPNDGVIFV